MASIERLFRAPYSMPNGVQVVDDTLWVADQISDRDARVQIADASRYGCTLVLQEFESESSNTSGMAYGDGSLFLVANGPGENYRPVRPTDAAAGEILRVDPDTGETQSRWDLPGGGGSHGIEYDPFEDGVLWLTTLKSQTLTKVRISGWEILNVLPLPHTRAHGVVRVEDGIWVVHTADRVIVKMDLEEEGKELDRIDVPEPYPEPHGLSIYNGGFLYCDATSGWVAKIDL